MGVVVNKIHPEYVSGGCNHSAHALDADYSQNVIVYASNKNVFELHISSGGVARFGGTASVLVVPTQKNDTTKRR